MENKIEMETKIISTGLLAATLVCFASPARAADSNTVGANYLMTHTWLDPQKQNSNQKKAIAQSAPTSTTSSTKESTANTKLLPSQILRTGVVITSTGLSANTMQLADNIGLTPLMEQIHLLSDKAASNSGIVSIESLTNKQDLLDTRQKARMLIQKTGLEVDATIAEISAERELYNEILTKFKEDRDKAIAKTNAFAFISNGALWAVTEAFVIPTYKHAIYNVPAGIVGIPAGMVPSAASMYTLKLINGKKQDSEVEPNMLAKIFKYQTNSEIEYPKSVWDYLNGVPADVPNSKKRIDQLIDRWIADSNIPGFTDRNSKKQLDVITASVSQRKGLTISSLTVRTVLLDQLLAEVVKMKRMLLELEMVTNGDKRFIANAAIPKQL
ncbi:hypothetical protein KF707_18395 [Candidatus Obscuribacterales bacterium]|nr:hypothetical protein [Candidatus Obscuribacterales bacterium]